MNHISSPLVSIAMPIFNCAKFLEYALESLIKQTYKNIEIIICNNNSSDKTTEIIDKYISEDNRIIHHINPTTLCMRDNFNLGFKLASGPYFMWASCDDIWHPTFIEKAIEILEKEKEIIAVDSLWNFINEANEIVATNAQPPALWIQPTKNPTTLISPPEWSGFYCLYRSNIVKSSNLLVEPVVDFIFQNAIAIKGPRIRINESLFSYRGHLNKDITKRLCYKERFFWTQTIREFFISINEESSIDQKTKDNYTQHIFEAIQSRYAETLILENQLKEEDLPGFLREYILNPTKPLPIKLPSPFSENKNSKKKKKKLKNNIKIRRRKRRSKRSRK